MENVYYHKNRISHISYLRTTKQSFLVSVSRKKICEVLKLHKHFENTS